MATGLEKSVFIPIPKKGNAKECSNYCTTALISHTSKVLLKILQARLQQYVNCEFPDVQAGFRKGSRTRDQIANIHWIIEKAREFQKNIYFCFTDYSKAFDCVDHKKLWKILKEMGIPDHLPCLLRNLYAGQEATVRTGHGTIDWFQIGKSANVGDARDAGSILGLGRYPGGGNDNLLQCSCLVGYSLRGHKESDTTE